MPGFNITGIENGPRATQSPMFSHRWEVILNIGLRGLQDSIRLYAMSVDRPKETQSIITLHNGANELYLPGKIKWEPITITLYDNLDENNRNNSVNRLKEWRSKIVNYNNYTLNYTNSIRDLKSTMFINLKDGLGKTITRYTLYGAWPFSISPSSLTYAESTISTTVVNIVYDAAKDT